MRWWRTARVGVRWSRAAEERGCQSRLTVAGRKALCCGSDQHRKSGLRAIPLCARRRENAHASATNSVPITASGAQGEQPLATGKGRPGNSAKWTFNFGRRVASASCLRGRGEWQKSCFGSDAVAAPHWMAPGSGGLRSGRSDSLTKTQYCDGGFVLTQYDFCPVLLTLRRREPAKRQ